MKKSIIAMAVAGALAVPAIASADATLYGSLRMAMQDVKGDSLALNDQASRVGIRGTVDLGLEDTKGLFQVEQQVDLNSGVTGTGRLGIIGATGSWGTVLGGKFNHPSVSMVTDYTDNTYSGRYANVGAQYHDKQGNTLAYASPVFNGVQFVIGGVFAGDALSPAAEKDKAVDGYNLGLKYDANDIYAAIAYGNVKSGKAADGTFGVNQNVWGLALGYSGIENLDLMANWSRLNDKTGSSNVVGRDLRDTIMADDDVAFIGFDRAKATAWNISATYHIGHTHVYGGYGRTSFKSVDGTEILTDGTVDDFTGGSASLNSHYVGVGHTLGRGVVFAQYENSRGTLKAYDNPRTVSAGYRLSF